VRLEIKVTLTGSHLPRAFVRGNAVWFNSRACECGKE